MKASLPGLAFLLARGSMVARLDRRAPSATLQKPGRTPLSSDIR
jgi:hypothetical protein